MVNFLKQPGGTEILFAVLVLITLIGGLGYVYWNNFQQEGGIAQTNARNKTEDPVKNDVSDEYFFHDAIEDINTVLAKQVCGLQGPTSLLEESDVYKIADNDVFTYRPGKSLLNEKLNYAYVQYGCGSQGNVALLKRTSATWELVSDDARIYPLCEIVRGKDFPRSIVDKCYENNIANEPVEI